MSVTRSSKTQSSSSNESVVPSGSSEKVILSICSTIAGIAVLTTYTILKLNNVDTDSLLPFVVGIAALIPGISMAAKNSRNIIEGNKGIREIQRRTNGPLTETADAVKSVDDRLLAVEGHLEMLSGTITTLTDGLQSKGYI